MKYPSKAEQKAAKTSRAWLSLDKNLSCMQSTAFAASVSPTPHPSVFISPDNSVDKTFKTGPRIAVIPGGGGLAENDLERLRDWQLAVIALPVREADEFYSLDEIAEVVGTATGYRLSRYAKRIWPNWVSERGRYRLHLPEAERLIRFYLQNGQQRHAQEELLIRAGALLDKTTF